MVLKKKFVNTLYDYNKKLNQSQLLIQNLCYKTKSIIQCKYSFRIIKSLCVKLQEG